MVFSGDTAGHHLAVVFVLPCAGVEVGWMKAEAEGRLRVGPALDCPSSQSPGGLHWCSGGPGPRGGPGCQHNLAGPRVSIPVSKYHLLPKETMLNRRGAGMNSQLKTVNLSVLQGLPIPLPPFPVAFPSRTQFLLSRWPCPDQGTPASDRNLASPIHPSIFHSLTPNSATM